MKESLGVLEFVTSFSCTRDFQLKLYPNPGTFHLSCCFASKTSMQAVLERSLSFLSVDSITHIFKTRNLPYGPLHYTTTYNDTPSKIWPGKCPTTNSQYNVRPVGKWERFDVVPLGRWKAYEPYESNKISWMMFETAQIEVTFSIKKETHIIQMS